MDKNLVHSLVIQEVQRRIDQLNELLNDAFESTATDTKSSAGDKHETSRAMAQLEQEKIGNQLAEMNKLQGVLHRIDPSIKHDSVRLGSLVRTNAGWFYLSVGIGGVLIGNETIFCLTPQAPVGALLMSKKVHSKITFNSKEMELIEIY